MTATKYQLECPKCETRFNLKKYVPDRRVRCRKCKAIIVIPREDGALPNAAWQTVDLDPELYEKVKEIYSLKKLAIVSGLLFAALVGGAIIFIHQVQQQDSLLPEVTEEENLTPDQWVRVQERLPIPLARDLEWHYALPEAETEVRRITGVSRGEQGSPQFDLTISRGKSARTMLLRVESDGIYVLSEREGNNKYRFDPPMKLVPLPLYLDSEWEYEGNYKLDGGGDEKWKLSFTTLPESVITLGGTRLAYKVHMTGARGLKTVDETVWYCNGLGVVKFEDPIKGDLRMYNADPPPAPIPDKKDQ